MKFDLGKIYRGKNVVVGETTKKRGAGAALEGGLYLVATPIGNLEDITLRALRALSEADVIYAEDTRRARQLVEMFDVQLKLGCEVLSFHDHSNENVLRKLTERLVAQEVVVFVSDAGMPTISDPGYELVQAAIVAKTPVTVVPGASSVATFFSGSGLKSPKFLFHGFFPRTKGEVEQVLQTIKLVPVVHVFFESPHRIKNALSIVAKNLPHSEVAVARELTKIHEEWVRGISGTVAEEFQNRTSIKGEFVFGVLARQSQVKHQDFSAVETLTIDVETQKDFLTPDEQEEVRQAVLAGGHTKDIAKSLSKKFRVHRKLIYEFIIRDLT